MLGRERLAVGLVGDQRVLVLENASGTFAVKPCSACATTKRALGFGRTSLASSRQWTPRKRVSNRLQRVTQWMSSVISVARQRRELLPGQPTGSSTSPKTRKSQVARSVLRHGAGVQDGPLLGQVLARRQRAGSYPASATFCSALERNTIASLH